MWPHHLWTASWPASQMTYRSKQAKKDDAPLARDGMTLEWMRWCESRTPGHGTAGEAAAKGGPGDSAPAAMRESSLASGGILGHLSWEKAVDCLVTLTEMEANGKKGQGMGRCVLWPVSQLLGVASGSWVGSLPHIESPRKRWCIGALVHWCIGDTGHIRSHRRRLTLPCGT